jgi:hypothetical protein
LWVVAYVENENAQRAVREVISRESSADAAARYRKVASFSWASTAAFLLVLFVS